MRPRWRDASGIERFGSIPPIIMGGLLVLFAPSPSYHALGLLLLNAGIALLLWFPLLGILTGWPVPAEVAVRRFSVRHWLISAILMFGLFLGPAVAPQTAVIVRTPLLPFPLRVLALLLAVFCAVPFWTFVIGWRRIKNARRLQPERNGSVR